jgi:hypothetical protein
MPSQSSSPNPPSSNISPQIKLPNSTASLRIRFEQAMKRGLTLKELKDEFREIDPKNLSQRISALGYQKHYLTNEEYKHILARRKIQNETTT